MKAPPTDLEKLAERLVTVSTDRMTKRMFDDVPAKYDTQTDASDLKLAEVIDAAIFVGRPSAEGLFADADPKRLATRAKAGGDNKTPYGYFVSLPGTTVMLDGKAVVEAGQLKL